MKELGDGEKVSRSSLIPHFSSSAEARFDVQLEIKSICLLYVLLDNVSDLLNW
jgi:hypothetical protein